MSECSSEAVTTADMAGWVGDLLRLDASVDDSERIDQLRLLEVLKSAAAAAQARITVAFEQSQRAAQEAAGVPPRKQGAGVAAQVALARRDSPFRGSRHVGLARALVHEMPHTMEALQPGEIEEWRATLLVRETACLSRIDRGVVDAELSARPGGLGALGDRAVAAEASRVAYRLDPYAFVDRARKAEADRRVTCRPAPDTMAHVSALLPAKQGVAVFAALTRNADALRSGGDGRTRGQLMADTLVERVTGQAVASEVPVEIGLVMTDATLFGDDVEPAELEGYGPVPAPLARQHLRDLPDEVAAWVRRLYVDPGSGTLVAMESARRLFEGTLRRVCLVRDQRCRTPWCDAPVRHVDHVRSAASGGATSAINGQGLCEACNLAMEAPGWRAEPHADGSVRTRTPTGHRYLSRPPPLPGARSPAVSRAEIFFRDIVLAA